MSHHYIRFNDVHFTYPNGYEALKGVSFLITHGEKVALLGLNGAGKSTVLLHTNGLLMPTSGEVNVGDIPVTKKTLPIVRQSVGMVFQNADDQLFMLTVEEDVAFGPLNMGLDGAEVDRRVVSALESVGASDLRTRSPFRLSGGQKKRVAIATVLSMEPSILVMDEPTAEL
ncbi:MAG: energy-coupling factor ABC transporter ATP-binding protein, partial [Muribaculaceae bacterium]|nr:energy-coupling factor ABC transporter ATP-binding protein [Muribaculaceae bacterium]